jgi:hypothetical protein
MSRGDSGGTLVNKLAIFLTNSRGTLAKTACRDFEGDTRGTLRHREMPLVNFAPSLLMKTRRTLCPPHQGTRVRGTGGQTLPPSLEGVCSPVCPPSHPAPMGVGERGTIGQTRQILGGHA